jgi:hypothetical protein
MEVSVHTEYDQFSSSQMGRSGASITDPEVYKAHEVSFNVDVESGLEEKWGNPPLLGIIRHIEGKARVTVNIKV